MPAEEQGFPCKDVIAACDELAKDITARITDTILKIRGNAIIPTEDNMVEDPFSLIAESLKEVQHKSYTATIDALNMQVVNVTRQKALKNLRAIRSSVLLSPTAQSLLIPYMDASRG
jgi:hypothetical protein